MRSSRIPIRIELSEARVFFPIDQFLTPAALKKELEALTPDQEYLKDSITRYNNPSFEVSQEFLDEYRRVTEAYFQMVGRLQVMYHAQNFGNSGELPDSPDYTML